MPVDNHITEQQNPTAAGKQPAKRERKCQSDDAGSVILPGMQHFVTLLRKVKRPSLVLLLVERASDSQLPEIAAVTDVAKGHLAIESRQAMFHAVAKLGADVRHRIEHAHGQVGREPWKGPEPPPLRRLEQQRAAHGELQHL